MKSIVYVFFLAGLLTSLVYAGNETNYFVVQLPSLGGTVSSGSSINNVDWVSGFSTKSASAIFRATLWQNKSPMDLGSLGGQSTNSAVLWPVKNDHGLIAGVSETSTVDPLGEAWSCSAFFALPTGHICVGFAWQNDVMTPLPTLGGNNGFATGANNRDQIVGWAENTVHDPTCNPPQVLQFRAVIWGPGANQIQQLPPLPGDTTTAATAINDKGQVVGISGICDNSVGRFSAIHAVLWEKGRVTDLGSLGGVAWNTPMAINASGDVVGFANTATGSAGGFHTHAFLWTKKNGMQDLGTLPGDTVSLAYGINGAGVIVGQSVGASGSQAFVWKKGVMKNLNELTLAGSPVLLYGNDVNDIGEITGQAYQQSSGDVIAFLAIPPAAGIEAAIATAEVSGRKADKIHMPKKIRSAALRHIFGLKPRDLK